MESERVRYEKEGEDQLDEKVLRKMEAIGGWVRPRQLHQAISRGVKTEDIRRSLGRLESRRLVKSRVGPTSFDEWALVEKG